MTADRGRGLTVKAPDSLFALFDDECLRSVFAALDAKGEETRIVGGALRNVLCGKPAEEIDLATTLLPGKVMEMAAAGGLRAIPTGLSHGTVTVLAGGKTFEVTTLREDIATDGRHAQVRFGRDFHADALRRDFTINALSMTRGGMLFDYTGGLEDIAARKVRFIGEPERRIAEDYLRILRFFRFSAEYGEGPLDPAGRLAAIRQREGLGLLSRERVRAELLKLLCARRAAEVCAEMSGDGLLHPLIASVPYVARLRRAAAVVPAADPLLRLAALSVELREDALRLRACLRLSNSETSRLENAASALLKMHGRDTPPDSGGLRRLLFRHGRGAAADALVLAQAEARPGRDSEWNRARKDLDETKEPRLPFSGADIVARGVTEGRAVGEALKDLEERWIAAGFPEDAATLTQILDNLPCLSNS
ncbi:MAG TPA: CCA tRNA nucleotidyltransferase [Methylocella sp.]|nr:CCA tRNA nucleotidyltransferase [Methylocella sp.]